jgi:hypothetical protein
MKKLSIEKIDLEQEILIVRDSSGDNFTLPINSALRTAVYQVDSKHSELPVRQLTPKDIQRKIRAGVTPAELAKVSDLTIDEINRFALPIQGEKKIAIGQFRSVIHDRKHPQERVDSIIAKQLLKSNLSLNDLVWEAVRIDDNPWHIRARLNDQGETVDAAWLWDPDTSAIEALNEDAERLLRIPERVAEQEAKNAPATYQPRVQEVDAFNHKFSDAVKTEYQKLYSANNFATVKTNAPAVFPPSGAAPSFPPTPSEYAVEPSIAVTMPLNTQHQFPVPESTPLKPVKATETRNLPEVSPDTPSKSKRMKVPSWDQLILGN